MVSPEHMQERFLRHGYEEHAALSERLRLCEEALGIAVGRIDAFEAALAAHAEEPVEIVYTEVSDSPEAEVDVAEAEDDAQANIAESESGEASIEAEGEEERASG